jgi:hypothetical protein
MGNALTLLDLSNTVESEGRNHVLNTSHISFDLQRVKCEIRYQVSSILQEEIRHVRVTVLTGIRQSSVSRLCLSVNICRSFQQIPENSDM